MNISFRRKPQSQNAQAVGSKRSSRDTQKPEATKQEAADSIEISEPKFSKWGGVLGAVAAGAAGIAAGVVGGVAGVALALPAAVMGGFAVGGAAYLAATKMSDSMSLEEGAGPAGGYLGFVATAAAGAIGGPVGAVIVGLGTAALGGMVGGRLLGDAGWS